jgi:type IV secretory pathway VirB6-like protein
MYLANWTWGERLDTWIPIVFFVLLWAFMQWHQKMPSTTSIQEFVAVVNSRGGNILVLAAASVYFFKYSMYVFMHLLSMVRDKSISESNAFGLMAIQYVTTSAFGGAMGALLKTMTGESSKARSSDSSNGNGNGNGAPANTKATDSVTVTTEHKEAPTVDDSSKADRKS